MPSLLSGAGDDFGSGGAIPPTGFINSLDFSDGRNSEYYYYLRYPSGTSSGSSSTPSLDFSQASNSQYYYYLYLMS